MAKKSEIIFIDTNILLAPLKVDSGINFEDLLFTFYPFIDSVVIPGQVYSEFNNNIGKVYESNKASISSSTCTIETLFEKVNKQLELLGYASLKAIKNSEKRIVNCADELKQTCLEKLKIDANKCYDFFPILFSNKASNYYSYKEKYALMAEYDARCKRQIAPGYLDSDKSNGNDYGDLIIWQEIIDYMDDKSESDIVDSVFVTNDCKADWRGPKSESQLQCEYEETVFDGSFRVRSYKDFIEDNKTRINSFKRGIKELIVLFDLKEWSDASWTEFCVLVDNLNLSFPFFLSFFSLDKLENLRKLIIPYREQFLKFSTDFLKLSQRSQICLKNAGIFSLNELMTQTVTEMAKTRCFGKRSLSEICERRLLLNKKFGPFVEYLDSYQFNQNPNKEMFNL